ncbi:protein-disulfide isomerase [Krasilnikovia cinnamomea]|uniref:Protein-disulfide isomerase n=1 Tax=Krasilnikovia cinnamomea TaxID=349313 RepID=A0A4Q7ZUQ5_9ACTN|nr:thioredoxin domain-containing protein [Krasilnikovia cinnamomea]RZU54315.1 protein-disulfide isomerase [Krasilnikovia cinnamomea]
MGKQAREQSRQVRKGQAAVAAAQSGRPRWPAIAGLVVVVGLLTAIVFTIVRAATNDSSAQPTASGPVVAPSGAAGGALVSGKADAPVKLEIYADYMCPYCGRFERANGAEIARLVDDGTVRQYQYPLAFLDEMSDGTRYSTRAANAAATVYDQAPDKLAAFDAALYANQPAEGSAGLSDERIAELARQAGVPPPVVESFTRRVFEPWVATSTQAAFASGLQGTPTVKINGEVFEGDLYTVGPLTEAITAAAK